MPARSIKVWNSTTSEWEDVAVASPDTSSFVQNSLVNARGDLVTATANDTPAILTAGSNGQMLMADSSATAGLRYVDPPTNRNLVINGAMQVAQRNTSVTSISSGSTYHTADRWVLEAGTAGTWTQSIETDSPTGSGFVKSLKMLCTTANNSLSAGSYLELEQRFEGQDLQRIRKGTANAEQLTLSFWVKSNVTGTYIVEVRDADNNRTCSASYSVSASATWERKTITIPADATGALDNDNANSLTIYWWLVAGSTYSSGTLATTWGTRTNANLAVGQTNLAAATNNYWQITGVQLETGPVATPFEFEPYEATLRKCQRYYQVHFRANIFAIAGANSVSTALCPISFMEEMRAQPTITLPAAGTGSGQVVVLDRTAATPATIGTHAAGQISRHGFRLDANAYTSMFSIGDTLFFWANNSGVEVYTASAEL